MVPVTGRSATVCSTLIGAKLPCRNGLSTTDLYGFPARRGTPNRATGSGQAPVAARHRSDLMTVKAALTPIRGGESGFHRLRAWLSADGNRLPLLFTRRRRVGPVAVARPPGGVPDQR